MQDVLNPGENKSGPYFTSVTRNSTKLKQQGVLASTMATAAKTSLLK